MAASKSKRGSKTTELGIGLVGTKFMGRAHANAWRQAPCFFDLKRRPRLQCVAGRDRVAARAFAERWEVATTAPTWEALVRDPKVHLVDVLTPNHLHAPIAIAALQAGKHVACEKPLAGSLGHARAMRDAARASKARTFVWFNYRRCPAIGLVRQLVTEGRLGTVRHARASYLQDWGGAATPMLWRFDAALAGSGAHGDLNAHLIDLTRALTGLEFLSVCGMQQTFTKERPTGKGKAKAEVTVDDAFCFLARFAGGAIGTFEATRVAPGRKNYNRIEISGTKGTIIWNLERMNELQFFSFADQRDAQGFRTIMCMDSVHPYAANWWPDGHTVGYEHTFVHHLADFVSSLKSGVAFAPNFHDGLKVQAVLEAAMQSVKSGTFVKVTV